MVSGAIDTVLPGYSANLLDAVADFHGFVQQYVSSTGDAVAATTGLPNDPAISVSSLPLSEGGSGTLTITLSEASDTNGQAVILTVYDPDLVRLSGPGVHLRDAAAGEYLVIVPAGQLAHTVTVTGLEDSDAYPDISLLRAELTPFSELGEAFREAPYAMDEIVVTDNDTIQPPAAGHVVMGTNAGEELAGIDDLVTNDALIGLGGADLIWGGLGDDQLFAEGSVNLAGLASLEGYGGATGSGLRGDWLSGGIGAVPLRGGRRVRPDGGSPVQGTGQRQQAYYFRRIEPERLAA